MDVVKLAREIQESAMPQWLLDYVRQHRASMRAELELFGHCEIPMPDGRVMEIRRQL